MELRLQPKPEVEILPANQGIVSRERFFVKKKFEEINQYFFPAHFIRNWKPKAELLYPSVSDETAIQYECDFNRDIQNCFVEDNAEEVFLRTPPPCFAIIGKNGASVKKLSKELADEFGSVLIQADDIINQLLQTETETAKILDRLLRLGVSLTLNFILALFSYVAHTAEARHRGYVLCGLPCIPDSYDLPADQQFNYLFTWDNKPTVFINVLFDDEDLIKERTNSRYEIVNSELGGCTLYHIDEYTGEDDDDDDEDDDEEEEEISDELILFEKETSYGCDINISPSRPWVKLPKDEESQVWPELELFDNKVRPAIKLITSRVDPQYFIIVDSRVQNEFEIVLARLSLLQIWRVPEAVPFIPPKPRRAVSETNIYFEDEENENKEEQEDQSVMDTDVDPDIMQVSKEPPQTAFVTLFTKYTISPKFRWELSHYNYICPVSLREGEIVEGKSEFSVIFMKYIYFLRDEESMLKFLRNPRAYVLPIRPLPPRRFIIVGYPYSGKTSLASALAEELSIPILDANIILKNDLDRKKNTYQEFCRQKAECREIIRLNAQAWQEWRAEEEHRITLIEEWIAYIQTLLSQRIEQFYSKGESDSISVKESQIREYSQSESNESVDLVPEGGSQSRGNANQEPGNAQLQVCGTALNVNRSAQLVNNSSPSDKLIKAMKHEDFDFNDPSLEVEANLFFSSLWNCFSNEDQRNSCRSTLKSEELGEELGEIETLQEADEESVTVDWCSLLPPQSLSSFLMSKIPYTTREKRQSFKIFLEAASKAYWTPCKLKTEFVKWRLPCFMDIPLCEIFVDNPDLLLKYVPEWLKERPQIPDPVDPMHPNVLEAGQEAFLRASVVTVKQNKEEVGTLLRNAIEKAEREGMRVTGEIISPGGWVMDNMTLDLEIWKRLACENVFPDHIYILIDTDPECRRIINTWCELNRTSLDDWYFSEEAEDEECEIQEKTLNQSKKIDPFSNKANDKVKWQADEKNIIEIIREALKLHAQGDNQLDEIFDKLLDELGGSKGYIPPVFVDPFSHHTFENSSRTWSELKDETVNEEALMTIHTLTHYSAISFFDMRSISPLQDIPVGPQLQEFTSAVLNSFKKKEPKIEEEKLREKQSLADSLQFFISLLTLPKKIEELKNWLTFINRDSSLLELEVTNRNLNSLLLEIRNSLFKYFIKKPRELESFEMEEILRSERRQKALWNTESENLDYEEEIEEYEGEKEDEEDLRIFGESGPLCVVNLERDIFLLGKPEISLRYYGKLYYFYNEAAKNQFLLTPEIYAPYYSVIRCYPPLRVFVVGPTGCGKTEFATAIAQQCSITYIDFINFLVRSLVPYFDPSGKKYTPLGDSKLLLSEDYNAEAKLVKEKFMNAPCDVRQFWFENPVYEEHLENILKFKKKIINLSEPVSVRNFPELTYECLENENEQNKENLLNLSESQETHLSMKEIEEIVGNYIQNNDELNEYCVEKSAKILWTTEPYLSQGFILESFPRRLSDVKYMIENNWIPDVVFELMLPEDVTLDRSIDFLMESWDTQLKQETVEEKLLEDTLTSVQMIWKRIRRNELIEEKTTAALQQPSAPEIEEGINSQNKPLASKALINEVELSQKLSQLPKEVEDGIQAKVDEILKEEFRELSFNPVFETYDAGKERIIDNFLKRYKKEMEEMDKMKGTLKDLGVLWYEVDSMKDSRDNIVDAIFKLDKIKKRLNCKGEFAFTVKMETAERLLKQGYYFLSKFGRWCPVQVYRMKNPIHMYRPLSAKGKVTAIAYRNYIYFVGGENEKINFLQDPVKYTFNEPHHPNIPLRVAVIGPPKSGKSTLSKRLGSMFDMKVVTMGSALRFVLEKIPKSTLAKSINSYLRRGCFLPLSLKVEALMTCLNDPACITQGFIFDGIPFDAALTQSLAEKGKLPFVIISLVADPVFGKTNRQNLDLKQFRLPYKNRVDLDSRYKDWNDTYKRFAHWNQNTYNNLYEVNAKLNVVDIFYQAYDIIRKSFFGILYYVEYCVSSRALPLHYLCVGQHEYELRKSVFHNNCPVCWVEENKLSSCVNPPPRSGLVQHLNYFYWICPKHMENFLNNPKMYIPPAAPPFPQQLPKMITKSMFESISPSPKIHGYGRCPVTRVDFPDALDWEGSWNFAAFYNNEVFLCKSKEMLNRFLARPWRFDNADTQFEVNRTTKSNAVEQLGPPKVTSLPPIGFLEQTVADSIHECLQILGGVRPIYPNMTPTTTGCTFLALYLKVHNKRCKSRELETQYFDFMIHNCKASKFRISPFTRPGKELKQGDLDSTRDVEMETDSSDEDELSVKTGAISATDQSYWLDLDAQADKKLWSAKVQKPDVTEMKLTSFDELQEIPELPKVHVVLKYQTYTLRSSPLPPVEKCLNFIYSIAPPLQVPEKFNYLTLYQPLPLFSSLYPQSIIFNPEKNFDILLHKETDEGFQSKENLYKGKRTQSKSTIASVEHKTDMDPDLELMIERFIPRFQLLDKMTSVKVPPIPESIEEEPIIFNPHRDYTYTLLLSEFFHTTHVLRCYEWGESYKYLEFSNILSKNLGLTNIQVEYFLRPHKTHSMTSRRSMDSYMDAFDAANTFISSSQVQTSNSSNETLESVKREKSSLVNFMQMILLEKLDEIFSRVSQTSFSYDSYEINVLLTESETNQKHTSIIIREVFPYPPLSWDIISRPYYAYCSIPSLFQSPTLDDIAHERHFSVLDGIIEPNDEIRFVRYPTWIQQPEKRARTQESKSFKTLLHSSSKHTGSYSVYDFFNLHWTSFLTYPFSWACNKDVAGHFCEFQDGNNSPLCANQGTK